MVWNNNATNYDEHLDNMKHELDRYDNLIRDIDRMLSESSGIHINSLYDLKREISNKVLIKSGFLRIIPTNVMTDISTYSEAIYFNKKIIFFNRNNVPVGLPMFIWDLNTDTWSKNSSLKITGSLYSKFVNDNNFVYFLQGSNSLSLYKFDLSTSTLSLVDNLNLKYYNNISAIAISNNKLYFVNATSSSYNAYILYEYDLDLKKLKTLTQLNFSSLGSMGIYNNYIYLMSGELEIVKFNINTQTVKSYRMNERITSSTSNIFIHKNKMYSTDYGNKVYFIITNLNTYKIEKKIPLDSSVVNTVSNYGSSIYIRTIHKNLIYEYIL